MNELISPAEAREIAANLLAAAHLAEQDQRMTPEDFEAWRLESTPEVLQDTSGT